MAESGSFPGYPGMRICIPSLSTPSVVTFFDGSRVNPIKEASLVLDQVAFLDDDGILQVNVKKDDRVSWLVTSVENESCGTYSPKFSLFHSDLGSPLSLYKDYKRVFDIHSEFSSSYSTIGSTISDDRSLSFSSFSDDVSEVMDLEECSIDKPLFWPYDLIPEWGSNTEWEFFVMSPRKNISNIVNLHTTPPETPRLRLLNKKTDLEKRCRQKLLFGPGSNSSANLDFKTTNNTRVVRRMKSMPSRFKKGVKTNEDGGTRESLEDKQVLIKKTSNHKVLLEDHLLVEKLNGEHAIETILGNDEFDGHEGVESEFNKDDFSLHVIL